MPAPALADTNADTCGSEACAWRVSTGADSGDVHNSVADDPQASNLLDLHSSSGNVTLAYGN